MLEAVSVASRQLLVLEPFDACETLFQPLQAAGWTLQRCTPETLNDHAGDALLLHLDQRPSHALLKQLQLTGLGCIVLADAERLRQIGSEELIGEWCFAALTLPGEMSRLLETLQQAQAATRLRRLKSGRQLPQYLGNCGAARSLRRQLDRLSRIEGPLLVSGERGSGKHLLARLLHQRSSFAAQAMRAIDCAEPLDEAALAASSVTSVLLENASLLSAADQQRLLDYLQRHPQAYLLTLDRGELVQALQQGRFRRDLFHLLAAQQLQTPNLREHPGDLSLLAEHFAKQHGAMIGRHHRRFSEEAITAMISHPWPGNVRELRNRVIRALVLAQGRQILAADLGLRPAQASIDAPVTLEDYILRAERLALNDVLGRYANNMSQAARTLGISRPTFYRLLHKHRLR
ncbi:sigma-54-dependent transcriptional regulator [Pseudomonas sihuiensis]|uniref:DNA-binding transcriptional response regulator, NtrC family, contains REC, AAA-type ATPase, and a Fis-type DNA-binding domains n=1 Tax=Pseudomonas sihuiensis TaxID=1274359 RepID=A0A1H2LD00_9PSED|nr:sigma 54-interacting transcriptional regulator [Pseudomonas sihuiensis]SDU78920.1 DNA-binding transcriptional response regulator, NtrC family, contains REC, AAA-type ATPase, and a Fis-type DNA-binding domains [Pseudomonas sihuiensis]